MKLLSPSLMTFGRAVPATTGALLVLALAATPVRAQEPDNSAVLTNLANVMALTQTNDSMQVEDLVSALRSLQPEDQAPGEEAGGTNAAPGANDSSNPGSDQYYRRPSGRESRSRWSSRQRTNRFGSDYSSGSVPAGTATNRAPVSLDYSAFRLIVDRNIFDPNRRPHTTYTPRDTTPSRDPVYFTLVGTMSYEEGTFAFFSGSSSDYQKAVKCSDSIAGYKVTEIEGDAVKLARDTNQVELHIGMQMRRDDDGNWSRSSLPSTYTVNDFQPASTSSSSSAAAPSGAESEILKRLMEKREKE